MRVYGAGPQRGMDLSVVANHRQFRQDCEFIAADGSRTDEERRFANTVLSLLTELACLQFDNATIYRKPDDGWVCFHCGERFLTYETAKAHFGEKPGGVDAHHRLAPDAAEAVREGSDVSDAEELQRLRAMRNRSEGYIRTLEFLQRTGENRAEEIDGHRFVLTGEYHGEGGVGERASNEGERTLEDGFGSVWALCGDKECWLEVVRPGKVQCNKSGCDGSGTDLPPAVAVAEGDTPANQEGAAHEQP